LGEGQPTFRAVLVPCAAFALEKSDNAQCTISHTMEETWLSKIHSTCSFGHLIAAVTSLMVALHEWPACTCLVIPKKYSHRCKYSFLLILMGP
jgi:hypothetical protein